MKRLMIGLTSLALLTSPVAIAQSSNNRDRPATNQQDHRGQMHQQSGRRDNGLHRGWGKNRGNNYHWGRGQRMGYNDWRNARRINYRALQLRQPLSGYEWRRTGDRFVMAQITTGLIQSVILSNGR